MKNSNIKLLVLDVTKNFEENLIKLICNKTIIILNKIDLIKKQNIISKINYLKKKKFYKYLFCISKKRNWN